MTGATLNKSQLKERGWTDGLIRRLLPPPVVEERHRYRRGSYTVYLWNGSVVRAAEQTEDWSKARDRRERAAARRDEHRHVDLLAAIFTVNRAAKRQRDLAQTYYQRGMHGFAGSSKDRKQGYYELKDRGIVAAHGAGRLTCAFRHGGLYLWTGEGYSFHSTLKPEGAEVPELPLGDGEEHFFVEAKPKGTKEPRLTDALRTLDGCAAPDLSRYERAPSPERRREPRSITCWNCGLAGRIASECFEETYEEAIQ
jgi:hypothetical protein